MVTKGVFVIGCRPLQLQLFHRAANVGRVGRGVAACVRQRNGSNETAYNLEFKIWNLKTAAAKWVLFFWLILVARRGVVCTQYTQCRVAIFTVWLV